MQISGGMQEVLSRSRRSNDATRVPCQSDTSQFQMVRKGHKSARGWTRSSNPFSVPLSVGRDYACGVKDLKKKASEAPDMRNLMLRESRIPYLCHPVNERPSHRAPASRRSWSKMVSTSLRSFYGRFSEQTGDKYIICQWLYGSNESLVIHVASVVPAIVARTNIQSCSITCASQKWKSDSTPENQESEQSADADLMDVHTQFIVMFNRPQTLRPCHVLGFGRLVTL